MTIQILSALKRFGDTGDEYQCFTTFSIDRDGVCKIEGLDRTPRVSEVRQFVKELKALGAEVVLIERKGKWREYPLKPAKDDNFRAW